MSETPTVTVGLPFYNNKSTLLDAIRSVFAQSFEDWELILMDDGSSDGSLDIARSIADPRVRLISDGQNRKLPARLNQIHREARGKYSARLDADDLLHPDRLARQVALLEERPEVDVVGTLMYMMESRDSIYGIGKSGLAAREFQPWETLEQGALLHATITGKSQWFRDNPYDETWARFQDAELWCRTCRHSRFAEIEEPLYFVDEVTDDNVARFLRRMPYRRRILRIYGPQMVGWPKTLVRIGRTYAKGAVFTILGRLGKADWLVRRRSELLTPEQLAAAQAALEQIRKTPVPQTTPQGQG